MNSCTTYLCLTQPALQELLTAAPRQLVERFQQLEAELPPEGQLCIEQAWDAIARCLGNGTLSHRRNGPLVAAIFGDTIVPLPGHYVQLGTLTDVRVKEIATALEQLTFAALREKYFGLKRTFLGIDVSSYDQPVSEDDWQFTSAHFENLVAFMRQTADRHRCVAILISG